MALGGATTRTPGSNPCQAFAVNHDLNWQKSSYCGTGSCVEITRTGTVVLMRDSKNSQQEPLAFSPVSWQVFLDGVRAGQFSRP